MSERKIYEITRLMNDRANIESDMADAFGLVTGLFHDKYVKRLNDAFEKCRENCAKNPSKEVRLIQALKPFTPEENQGSLENAAQVLMLMETLSNIRNEANIFHAGEAKAQAKKNKAENSERLIFAADNTVTEDKVTNADKSVYVDNAIHDDGIYEMDMSCVAKRAGGMPVNRMSIVLAGLLMGDIKK